MKFVKGVFLDYSNSDYKRYLKIEHSPVLRILPSRQHIIVRLGEFSKFIISDSLMK